MLTIHAIPAFEDNYFWVIERTKNHMALVVDPGDAEPVLYFLKEKRLKLEGILLTHKHHDHIGGVEQLLQSHDVPVYGNKIENISSITKFISDGDVIRLPNWPGIQVLSVPGHTLGHVAYLIENHLFCGDTMFGAGCGRLFEGAPEQMLSSLKKITALPDDTLIYCAHEYTLKNLQFAKMIEPYNQAIQDRIEQVEQLRKRNIPSVPFTLKIEKETNPFLRCKEAAVQEYIRQHASDTPHQDELAIFTYLREQRNQW